MSMGSWGVPSATSRVAFVFSSQWSSSSASQRYLCRACSCLCSSSWSFSFSCGIRKKVTRREPQADRAWRHHTAEQRPQDLAMRTHSWGATQIPRLRPRLRSLNQVFCISTLVCEDPHPHPILFPQWMDVPQSWRILEGLAVVGMMGVGHRLETDRDTKQLVHGNRHLTSVSGTGEHGWDPAD